MPHDRYKYSVAIPLLPLSSGQSGLEPANASVDRRTVALTDKRIYCHCMRKMPRKILLIDDDLQLTELLDVVLRGVGFEVRVAHAGLAGLRRVYEDRLDLVILDGMLPGIDGWEVCRRIREVSNVPILMLTGKSGDADKMRGLMAGADVYMTKPFDIQVLLAQVEAMLRRTDSSNGCEASTLMQVGDLEIDLRRREARLAGRPLRLTPLEFRLLSALASRPGEVVPGRELLTLVWGPQYAGESVYLKLYISYLRQKIEEDSRSPRYILNKRGVGYYLNPTGATGRLLQPTAAARQGRDGRTGKPQGAGR